MRQYKYRPASMTPKTSEKPPKIKPIALSKKPKKKHQTLTMYGV